MKLVVDVMGFENDINEAIKACRHFLYKYKDTSIILVGDKELIESKCKKDDIFSIVNSKDVIEQNDTILDVRKKKESSMEIAIKLVKDKKANGVLTAGSSSIFVFLTYKHFNLIEGIKKIGFMSYIPSFQNNGFNVLDMGASIECDGQDLYMFALMANIYVKSRGVKNPRINVLNIGIENHKGFIFHKEVDTLLKNNKEINYCGFIEPKTLLEGTSDLVVTDGYAGNIFLKSLEGTSKSIFNNILKYYKKPIHWIFAPFSIGMLLSMRKKFDYKNNAGAFVLGLNHIAVKTHGSADFKQFYSSLRMLRESVQSDIITKIKNEVKNESKRMKN